MVKTVPLKGERMSVSDASKVNRASLKKYSHDVEPHTVEFRSNEERRKGERSERLDARKGETRVNSRLELERFRS